MKNYSQSPHMNKHCSIGLLFGLSIIAAPTVVSAADVYALVVGIDGYQNVPTLEGAVNDAKDVTDALNGVGAKQVVLLQDKTADRESILKNWKALTAQATQKDDVFVFAYAGHGSQEKERVANSETDHMDENFLLANYADSGKENAQRIVDDELEALFRETPNLKILFVADSCHSGTITRGFSGPKKFKKRSVPPINPQNDTLTTLYGAQETRAFARTRAAAPSATASGEAVNILSLSGVPDDEEVVEVKDPDTKQPRGALSMAFAKALRNAAANNEQTLSKQKLQHFVFENVRMTTDGKQKLQTAGGDDSFFIPINAKIASNASASQPPTPTAAKAPAPPADFTVFVTNVPASVTEAQWKPVLGQAKVSSDKQTANAVWDIGDEKIFSQMGDVIYNGKQPKVQETRAFARAKTSPASTTEITYATKVFDKLMLVERIKRRSEAVTPTIALKPNDKLHRAGEQVSLEVSEQTFPALTVFNIASDGTIDYLYPITDASTNDPLEVPLNKPYTVPAFIVQAPFGGDHFVVIFSEKPLTNLHKALQEMNGGQNANRVEAALDASLQGVKHQIGIHGVFTAP